MFGYIKYRLLQWLLGDICRRSGTFIEDCKDCNVNLADNVDNLYSTCAMNGIYKQAVKVWKLWE